MCLGLLRPDIDRIYHPLHRGCFSFLAFFVFLTMDQRDAEVEAVLDKHVKDSSKNTYCAPAARFLCHVAAKEENVITAPFRAALDAAEGEAGRFEVARTWIKEKRQPAPINFDLVSATVIQRYLVGLRKSDGSKPGKSTYATARSSVRFLFTLYKARMSPETDAGLSQFMKGIKRDVVERQQKGELPVREGKEPFTFELYHKVCMAMLKLTGTEGPFLHLVHVLAWCLMCRVENVFHILLAHMSWAQDSLTIVFAQQKNDQDGDRPREPRHLYANPFDPAVCPLTALGIFLLTTSHNAATALFLGESQYARFTKGLKKVLSQAPLKDALAQLGLSPADFGAHSDRKGAATFLSGCQGGPSSISVCLGGGWTLKDVESRYFRWECAADCFVGRCLSALPLNSFHFAILPPFFVAESDALVTEAMVACFPSLPASITHIARMALASVVYHRTFLRANLPVDHLLFSSPLFALGLADRLGAHVECRLEREGDVMRATGVPPLATMLRQMEELRSTVAPLVDNMGHLANNVIKGVTQVLEERAIEAQSVTPAQLEEKLMDVFRRTGVLDFMQKANEGQLFAGGQAAPGNAAPAPAPAQAPAHRLYHWGGRFSKVPETFVVPKGSTAVAFQHWMFGSHEAGYPPLRTVMPVDVPAKQKERFSHLRWLMRELEQEAKQRRVWIKAPSPEEAVGVFRATMPHLGLPSRTANGRKRRVDDLNWGTVVNSLRKVRSRNSDEDEASDDDGSE